LLVQIAYPIVLRSIRPARAAAPPRSPREPPHATANPRSRPACRELLVDREELLDLRPQELGICSSDPTEAQLGSVGGTQMILSSIPRSSSILNIAIASGRTATRSTRWSA
jgi:hypothetical protein